MIEEPDRDNRLAHGIRASPKRTSGPGEAPQSGSENSAKELILFVLSLQPVGETLFFNRAVAGLSPSLTEIPTGQLPTGAILGKNSYGKQGYSICPAQGQSETYVFTLYALALTRASSHEPRRWKTGEIEHTWLGSLTLPNLVLL